jgi:hypothetical protein
MTELPYWATLEAQREREEIAKQLSKKYLAFSLDYLKRNKDSLLVTGDCIRIQTPGEPWPCLDLLVGTWGFDVGDKWCYLCDWALYQAYPLGEFPAELVSLWFEVLSIDREKNQAVFKLRTEVEE